MRNEYQLNRQWGMARQSGRFFRPWASFLLIAAMIFSWQDTARAQNNTPCECVQRWAQGASWNPDGSINDAPNAPAPNGIIRCGSSAETQSQVAPINNCVYDSTRFEIDPTLAPCVDPSTGAEVTIRPPENGQPIIWLNFDVRPNAGSFEVQINDNNEIIIFESTKEPDSIPITPVVTPDDNCLHPSPFPNNPASNGNADDCFLIFTGDPLPSMLECGTISGAPVSCNGNGSDGTATAFPAGGTPPYAYLWDNGEESQTATMLDPGPHTVVITDSLGCSIICEVNILPAQNCCTCESPPMIECPDDVNLGCNPPLDDNGIPLALGAGGQYAPDITLVSVMTDNMDCMATVTHQMDILQTSPDGCRFTLIRTYRATNDCEGLFSQCPQEFTWTTDNTPPAWGQPPGALDVAEICADDVVVPNPPTATDNCPDNAVTVTVQSDVTTPGPLGCAGQYTRVITYVATDECGDNESVPYTVAISVNDDVAPGFANCLNGSAGAIDLGCVATPPAADDAISAVGMPSDNCNLGGNTPSAMMTSTNTVDCITTETWEVSIDDACGNTGACTVTFSYTLSTDITLSACPGGPMLDGCSTQAQIDAAWDAWITGLQNMTVSGGCNPRIVYFEDLSTLPVPEDCANGQQQVSVSVFAFDRCSQAPLVTCTFTVEAPGPLMANCPGDMEVGDCLTQAEVDDAFAAWLAQFSATGGCNPQGSGLGQYSAPNFCGGTVTVDFTATDDCGRTDACSATFTVSTGLAVSCPLNVTLDGCTSQAEVDLAFASWIGQFSTTGGCNPQSTGLSQYYAPDFCGGRVTVIYKAKDICGREASCQATFAVEEPEPLAVSCPQDLQLGSCLTQAQVNSAFAAWLGLFSTSGGCFAESSNLQSYTAPDACGGSITVKYYAWDRCGQSAQCSAVFSVANAGPVVVSCPDDLEIDGCSSSQAQIDAAFNSWLGLFTATGGCSPQTSSLQNYSPPGACGGSVTVDFYAWDKCGNWDICSATFTVRPSAEPLEAYCPQNFKLSSCYSQQQINAAFASWLAQFSTSGGCSPQSGNLQGYSAPDACGGSVTVHYNAWDQCGQSASCSATFRVKEPAPLQVVCPPDKNLPACLSQSQIDAEFASWLSGFNTFGGCAAQHSSVMNYDAPSACGGSVTVKYYAWDRCGDSDFCTATFTVAASQQATVSCPPSVTLGSCISQANVNSAFYNWISQFESTGGCNSTAFYFVDGNPALSLDHVMPPPACGGQVYIHFFVMEECNRPTFCSSTFTVPEGSNGPQLSPAQDLTVECDGNGNSGALANWLNNQGGATASDDCGQVSWSNNYNGLTDACGATGSATVTFTATSQCGNASATTATFTIKDTAPPAGNCPPGLTGLASPGDAPGPDIAAVRAAYADLCGDIQVVFDDTETEFFGGSCSGFEVRHSFIIRDECGNRTTCTVVHSGGGTGSITGDCPLGKEDLTCDQGLQEFDADYLATFFTGADGERVLAVPVDTLFTVVGCEFTLIYDYEVRDNCGNVKECSITFTGFDTTPPIGECPREPVILQSIEEIPQQGDDSYIRQFYMDECGELVINELERDYEGGPCTDIRITITYEITDPCGNGFECFVEYEIPEVGDCGDFTVTYPYRAYDDCDNFVNCYIVHSGSEPGNGFAVEEGAATLPPGEALGLFVYPNPTSDELFLEFEHFNGERAELTVYNVYGKPALTRALALDRPNYRLSLTEEGLSSGSYFISVRTENTVLARKIVLARQ